MECRRSASRALTRAMLCLISALQFTEKTGRVDANKTSDLSKTKDQAKEERRGRRGGFGFSRWSGTGGSDGGESDDALAGRRRVTIGGTFDDDSSDDGLDADGRATLNERLGIAGSPSRLGGTHGGFYARGVTADFRKAGSLPEGVEIIGGDAVFEEQDVRTGLATLSLHLGLHLGLHHKTQACILTPHATKLALALARPLAPGRQRGARRARRRAPQALGTGHVTMDARR